MHLHIHAAVITKDISKYIHNYTSGYRVATKLLYVRLCPLLIIYLHLICDSHTAYLNTVQKWGIPQLCEVSRQLLCENMAYQRIMFFQLEIILWHNQKTMDWTWIWYSVPDWKSRLYNMYQFALGNSERENFPTPPNNIWSPKTDIRGCFNDFQCSLWKKMSRQTWGKIKICEENVGEHADNV